MDKKLTFVIPVYNVEAYLPQCLDSILSQATSCCELVLVDDGSPDRSGEICDCYRREYPDIKVIHKPNGGLASARNAGIAQAEGEYVAFVDSDDYIEPGTVSRLLHWIDDEPADVCFLELAKVDLDGSSEPMGERMIRSEIQHKPREQVLSFLAGRPKFPGSACGKLFRRAFLEKNELWFPDDRRLSEDLIFCLNAYLAAESFDYLDFPYYCYRQSRTGSITNTVTAKYYFDTSLFVTEVVQRFSENEKPLNTDAVCALSFAAYEFSILLWQSVLLQTEDRKRAGLFLKEYRWVLRYGQSGKTRMIHMAVFAFGIRGTARLLDLYMRRR
ncbi:MAG: glycosyltransferase family 2 protein [Oscillospiraceae bacterium]|nr:glycosyltransferase family 2 protein [Oscillospiraceae bacterium]